MLMKQRVMLLLLSLLMDTRPISPYPAPSPHLDHALTPDLSFAVDLALPALVPTPCLAATGTVAALCFCMLLS